MSELVAPYIELRDGPRGKRPRIAGKGVRVDAIAVWSRELKMSPEEIAVNHDLTLAEVHAALAYYLDHQDEMDARMEDDQRFVAEMKAKNPSLLQQKIRERLGD